MWPDASLAHRRRKGSKHLYNRLLTKQNQKWCSHRAPEKVFALLVSTVHVFSQLSLIQCYDLMGFGCLITCRGTSLQLLQRTEYVANSHHRLRVTHTLNPVPAHEFETECRCVSVGRNEQDDKESGKKRKARTDPSKSEVFLLLASNLPA